MALDLSFAKLADIAQSGGGGRPVEISLDEIIEDPNQPRCVFDEAELRDLAASISEHGVIQAISVTRKNGDGKHVIVFGARRYRASKLAGHDRIKVVVEDGDTPDAYVQLIENIQRDDLRPVEIAAFVTGRVRAGDKASDIGKRLGKPKDWVSRYAAVARMPEFLQTKLQTSPIRAVYELFQAWREAPNAVEQLCRERVGFTDAQARDAVHKLRAAGAAGLSEAVGMPDAAQQTALSEERVAEQTRATTLAAEPVPSKAPRGQRDAQQEVTRENVLSLSPLAVMVRFEDRLARLVTEQSARRGSRHACIAFADGGPIKEVALADLTLDELIPS